MEVLQYFKANKKKKPSIHMPSIRYEFLVSRNAIVVIGVAFVQQKRRRAQMEMKKKMKSTNIMVSSDYNRAQQKLPLLFIKKIRSGNKNQKKKKE